MGCFRAGGKGGLGWGVLGPELRGGLDGVAWGKTLTPARTCCTESVRPGPVTAPALPGAPGHAGGAWSPEPGACPPLQLPIEVRPAKTLGSSNLSYGTRHIHQCLEQLSSSAEVKRVPLLHQAGRQCCMEGTGKGCSSQAQRRGTSREGAGAPSSEPSQTLGSWG